MSSVSFIIPVYNKSSFLKYVIKCLKNQSGDFEREFIFVDDGSTDNSYEIISSLTKDLGIHKSSDKKIWDLLMQLIKE